MKTKSVAQSAPVRAYIELAPRGAEPTSVSLNASRTRIAHMGHDELMIEFMSLVENTAGTELDLQEALDAKFLMETLLPQARNAVFRSKLEESLRILNSEIAGLMN